MPIYLNACVFHTWNWTLSFHISLSVFLSLSLSFALSFYLSLYLSNFKLSAQPALRDPFSYRITPLPVLSLG